jgi:hypothetical protein
MEQMRLTMYRIGMRKPAMGRFRKAIIWIGILIVALFVSSHGPISPVVIRHLELAVLVGLGVCMVFLMLMLMVRNPERKHRGNPRLSRFFRFFEHKEPTPRYKGYY